MERKPIIETFRIGPPSGEDVSIRTYIPDVDGDDVPPPPRGGSVIVTPTPPKGETGTTKD